MASDVADRALLEAAQFGTLETVKASLTLEANVNVRGLHGETSLIWAAVRGEVAMVEALLLAGADVNARDDDTETVLMWAAGRGQTSVVNTPTGTSPLASLPVHRQRIVFPMRLLGY